MFYVSWLPSWAAPTGATTAASQSSKVGSWICRFVVRYCRMNRPNIVTSSAIFARKAKAK